MKKILVLGSGLDAALIAEVLNRGGVCEAFVLVAPEREEPPTIPEMVHLSDVPKRKSEGIPKHNPRMMPEKSVRMRAKNRS